MKWVIIVLALAVVACTCGTGTAVLGALLLCAAQPTQATAANAVMRPYTGPPEAALAEPEPSPAVEYEINSDNAIVRFSIRERTWQNGMKSDLMVSSLHRQYDDEEAAAPSGYARWIMCETLKSLVRDDRYYPQITRDSTVAVEADDSLGGGLVDMYQRMGFVMHMRNEETMVEEGFEPGGVMAARVGTIIDWCAGAYP